MNKTFIVTRINFKTISALPEYWNETKYRELLDLMEFDNAASLATAELKDMCLMSLTDNEPEEAAKLILTYVFKNKFNKGQID
ncbi:MAG: hypothetical protein WBB24_02690, partial [Maribacter sp.]